MADFFPAQELEKRQFVCRNGFVFRNGRCRANHSSWYYWGRWVLAGVLIIVFLAVLCLLGCLSSRRRKKKGAQPMYGTGWMANGWNQNQNQNQNYNAGQGYNNNAGQPQYNYGQQNWNQQQTYGQPPAYGQQPQHTGNTFNANDGYYTGQNEGIQLQQPQNAYAARGHESFSAPPGPPPGKA